MFWKNDTYSLPNRYEELAVFVCSSEIIARFCVALGVQFSNLQQQTGGRTE
jgi:hypothetical protein